MIQVGGGVGHGGSDVITLQVRIIAQDLVLGGACCQHIQDILDTNAHTANTGAAAALARLNGDALEKVSLHG